MEINGRDGVFRPTFVLSRQTRDALAQYAALRWPVGRRKAVAKEWGLKFYAELKRLDDIEDAISALPAEPDPSYPVDEAAPTAIHSYRSRAS